MKTFVLLICLLPLAFAHWGSSEEKEQKDDKKYEDFMEFKDKLMKVREMEKKWAFFEEFMDWKAEKMESKGMSMPELTDKQKEEKFHLFLEFKKKYMMMEQMNKKKHIFEEFLEEKGYKKNQEDGEMKEHEGKFGDVVKKMKADGMKAGMMITHAFLGLCKCHKDDMGMEMKKMFGNKKEGGDESDMGEMFDGELPDFMGNTTAKATFLKSLNKEQQKKIFGFGLVKSMCQSAKSFILHAKQFEETYMKEETSE